MTRSDEPLFEPRIADWLEDDPYTAPDQALDIVLAAFPSIKQRRARRVPWRLPEMPNSLKLATVAVAVVLAYGGAIWMLGRRPVTGVGGPSPSSASPSASPAPSDSGSPGASIPGMTQAFTSPTFGYSLRYPTDWIATATTREGPSTVDEADIFEPARGERLRALSVVAPDGVVVDDWISQNLTLSDDVDCSRPRDTLEPVTIDGQAGRLRGFCGNPPATEIEAIVIVADRVYLFTLFQFREGEGAASEAEARALFDAFAATITLSPQDAKDSPSPS